MAGTPPFPDATPVRRLLVRDPFGDGYNDLSMLKLAGIGVAMANAAPEVRAEADYVTLSNEEDGVAAAIEKFCYDKG